MAARCVAQEQLQRGDAAGATTLEIDVVGGYRAEHLAAQLGAADEHVEASFAALAAQRPEVHRHVALRRLAVADRDVDHVAFVALDILQVLDEERFGAGLLEERLEAGIFSPQELELLE